MRFGERALTDSLPAEQTEARVLPLRSTLAAGASLMPVGKGHFLGQQGECTDRAVPCIADHLVRLSGAFFILRQQLLTLFTASPDGCMRGSCREAGKGAGLVQRALETLKGDVTGELTQS